MLWTLWACFLNAISKKRLLHDQCPLEMEIFFAQGFRQSSLKGIKSSSYTIAIGYLYQSPAFGNPVGESNFKSNSYFGPLSNNC